MSRNFPNWIEAYVRYAGVTEAPKLMHFFAGVSTVAGALRRKVWIDMKRYTWTPCFFIVFVAKPGIVAKTTTMDIALDLLREVEGINFGPDSITWQSLVEHFAAHCEMFQWGEEYLPMSAVTLASGELCNLIDPRDDKMLNAYISLWDGKKRFDKMTKTSGNDSINAPWINLIGCTTPSWIADNMPPNSVGGGFTSRCIFLWGEEKERYIPWVDEVVSDKDDEIREKLIEDLRHIAVNLTGPFEISAEARDWYRPLYEAMWKNAAMDTNTEQAEGYIARKQTHMCKLAMVLSASRSDDLVIELQDLQLAYTMLGQLEPDMPKVFSKIGRSEQSVSADRVIALMKAKGKLPYTEVCRVIQTSYPNAHDMEGILNGLIRSGYLHLNVGVDPPMLTYVGPA